MIQIDETIAIPVSRDEAWKVLSDPYQVISCVADAEITKDNGDGTYDGKLTVRFGPMRVNFNAQVELELNHDEKSGQITAKGKDGTGGTRMRTVASFNIDPQSTDDMTRVNLVGQVELGGRLAGQIEAAAGTVVKRMTTDFATALSEKLAPVQPAVITATGVVETGATTPAFSAGRKGGVFASFAAWWRRTFRKTQESSQS